MSVLIALRDWVLILIAVWIFVMVVYLVVLVLFYFLFLITNKRIFLTAGIAFIRWVDRYFLLRRDKI